MPSVARYVGLPNRTQTSSSPAGTVRTLHRARPTVRSASTPVIRSMAGLQDLIRPSSPTTKMPSELLPMILASSSSRSMARANTSEWRSFT